MPDRVSVGSPGGAGGNETEAVARELREYGDELRSDWSDFDGRAAKRFLYELADRLDAVRRSPKGEDHEAGIRAAVNAYYERPLDEPLAPGTSLTHFERAVAAYLSRRPSPVSGTEPDTAKLTDDLDRFIRRIKTLSLERSFAALGARGIVLHHLGIARAELDSLAGFSVDAGKASDDPDWSPGRQRGTGPGGPRLTRGRS